nr:protein sieve element occlusion b [Quercus suber]
MACNEDLREETLKERTKSIIGKLQGYSWHAQAVLTLAAFASDYGDFCRHIDQFHSSDHLTKPVGIMKRIPVLRTQPKIDDKHKDAILKLNKLIKETLNFIDCIVMLGHRSVKHGDQENHDEQKSSNNISYYVLWAIITVEACTTWMSCLNKDERKTEEFSRYADKVADKIADALVDLKIDIQRAEAEAYRKLTKFLKEPHGIVEVLNKLINAEDNEQPVKVFNSDTAVVSELISENKHVVCIVGMKGTGKTTQAKKIFDHSAIVGHFTARDWVTPTDQKAKQVWINKVCDILKKEKYLAVLDDFTAENEIKMPGKL